MRGINLLKPDILKIIVCYYCIKPKEFSPVYNVDILQSRLIDGAIQTRAYNLQYLQNIPIISLVCAVKLFKTISIPHSSQISIHSVPQRKL